MVIELLLLREFSKSTQMALLKKILSMLALEKLVETITIFFSFFNMVFHTINLMEDLAIMYFVEQLCALR